MTGSIPPSLSPPRRDATSVGPVTSHRRSHTTGDAIRSRTLRARAVATAAGAALLLTACADTDDDALTLPTGEPTEEPDAVEPAPEPDEQEPPVDDFDRDQSIADAEALLGTAEDDLEEDTQTRIVRRGDEDLPVTMDLAPGRRNVELDEVDGTWQVIHVMVEVPDDEDPISVGESSRD